MELEEKIRASTTGEGGFAIVNDNAQEIAALGVNMDKNKNSFSLTQEIEIMRGTLTKILAEAAGAFPSAEYRYGITLSSIEQHNPSNEGGKVTVTWKDSGEQEDFDIVVGCDGIGSKTRRLAFPESATKDCFQGTDFYVAFFQIPGDPKTDVPNSHFQHAPGGRSITVRPADRTGTKSSCYCAHCGPPNEKMKDLNKKPIEVQREAFGELFRDVPGLGVRAMEGIKNSPDFYCTQIAQIKLSKWHEGRVGLVGDAAYCPSGLTGQGTTLALTGSYVLAGELSKSPWDPESAFRRYQNVMEAYVRKSQDIPLSGLGPRLLNPWTQWGIAALRGLFWVVAQTGLWKVLDIGSGGKQFKIPEYMWQPLPREAFESHDGDVVPIP